MITLWKESLNNDGQQFHQLQQNKQSPLTSTHWYWTQEKTTTYYWVHWKSTSRLGTVTEMWQSSSSYWDPNPVGEGPPKIGKNKIFWCKIVIFHTKYPNKFRTSLRSAQFFWSAPPPPLTWNPGSVPATLSSKKVMICQRSRELPYYDCDVEQQ